MRPFINKGFVSLLLSHGRLSNIICERRLMVLGIETSCDDTAVAIVNSDKKVLSSVRYTNRIEQRKAGGICPATVAVQHRENLPLVVEQCLEKASCSFSEIDAIAVTTRPGLVIALKEGVRMAIKLGREHAKTLIPVHHMRAHALTGFLCSPDLKFPFLTLLISGGHSLIVLVKSVEEFEILGKSLSGSAGECLDKIARKLNVQELDEFQNIHPGAAIELLAKRSSSSGYLRYNVGGPSIPGADMNFSQLKSSFLNLAERSMNDPDFSIEDFAASAQHHVARHIISRLNSVMDHLKSIDYLKNIEHLVVSGGVASNAYINNGIRKLCEYYEVGHVPVPPHLCTDNGEMIAWTGILMLQAQSKDYFEHHEIPDMLYVHSKYDIGEDKRNIIPRKTFNKLSAHTIHDDVAIKLFNSEMWKKEKDISK